MGSYPWSINIRGAPKRRPGEFLKYSDAKFILTPSPAKKIPKEILRRPP